MRGRAEVREMKKGVGWEGLWKIECILPPHSFISIDKYVVAINGVCNLFCFEYNFAPENSELLSR